jgi:hypothetical protein
MPKFDPISVEVSQASPRRPTVFVVNRSCHDFSAAEKFGNLKFMTEGMIGKFNTGTMYRAVRRSLVSATADDYLLLTGQSILTAIATAAFATKFRQVNFLLYCGAENRYVVRRMQFYE